MTAGYAFKTESGDEVITTNRISVESTFRRTREDLRIALETAQSGRVVTRYPGQLEYLTGYYEDVRTKLESLGEEYQEIPEVEHPNQDYQEAIADCDAILGILEQKAKAA